MPHHPTDVVDLTHPRFAEFFDELPLWSAPFGLMLLDRVPLGRGRTIVDIGAGTGFLALELAMRDGAGTRVIAVDPWAAAVERLRAKVEHLSLGDRVEVVCADAADLTWSDGSVDLVVSNLGLNNFDAPSRVLARVSHLLRPGGLLVATTNLTGHMAELYDVLRGVLEAMGLRERLPALDSHLAHRGSVATVEAQLIDAGLEPVQTELTSWRWRFADGHALLRHHFIRLGFMPSWRGVIGEADAGPVLAELERRLNQLAAERGELALTIPTACFTARRPT